MSHRLFLPACHVRQQELQPGAVVLLAGAGWLASFLGFIMCCAEKCVRVRGVAVLPQPTAPRPPPYNPEYLKTLVRTYYSPVCLRVRRCVCVTVSCRRSSSSSNGRAYLSCPNHCENGCAFLR